MFVAGRISLGVANAEGEGEHLFNNRRHPCKCFITIVVERMNSDDSSYLRTSPTKAYRTENGFVDESILIRNRAYATKYHRIWAGVVNALVE